MAIVRQSKKRNAMLELLRSTTSHPSADWVHRQLKEQYPDLSLGTVYRNLNQLSEERLIRRVGVVNGQERFDGTVAPHAHFICGCCGRVLDLPDNPPASEYVQSYSDQYGFEVEGHEFYLRGLCEDCKKS